MTPGTYLRLRRSNAGATVADVAARFSTEPRWAEHVRAEWIELIESDAQPVTFATAVALSQVYAFDFDVLVALVAITIDPAQPLPDICRICGCTWNDACAAGCAWADAEATLCTACAPTEPASAAA